MALVAAWSLCALVSSPAKDRVSPTLTRLRRWSSCALARPSRFRCSVRFVGTFPIPPLAARNEPTTTSASQSKPIGIASRNVSAIEQGVVLSPSLPPRAARPAPCLGGSRAVLSLAQQGRQRSDRQAGRPTQFFCRPRPQRRPASVVFAL